MTKRKTLLSILLCLCVSAAGMAVGLASASAAPSIELTRGAAEPVESITTQLGGVVTNGGGDSFFVHVKPTGGAGCAANPNADAGEEVIGEFVTSQVNPVSFSENWTFHISGEYRECAWVTKGVDSEEVQATAEATFRVRQPHLALTISVPASVATGQTFQVVTTAQAETERSVFEYALPNTGDGCPANAAAAGKSSGENEILSYWDVTGGPVSETKNESVNSAGTYLFCAYFEYPDSEDPPELSANAQLTVLAPPPPPPPCIVPNFTTHTMLTSIEQSLHAAGCTVGRVRYTASRSVRRGDVIKLTPASGTKLSPGATIEILVSNGPRCVVPAIGRTTSLNAIERALRRANCTVGKIGHSFSSRHGRGMVVAVSPRPGTKLAPRAAVTIVVSDGRPKHGRRRRPRH